MLILQIDYVNSSRCSYSEEGFQSTNQTMANIDQMKWDTCSFHKFPPLVCCITCGSTMRCFLKNYSTIRCLSNKMPWNQKFLCTHPFLCHNPDCRSCSKSGVHTTLWFIWPNVISSPPFSPPSLTDTRSWNQKVGIYILIHKS